MKEWVNLKMLINCRKVTFYRIQLMPSSGIIDLHTHQCKKESNGWLNKTIDCSIGFTFSIINYKLELLQVIKTFDLSRCL